MFKLENLQDNATYTDPYIEATGWDWIIVGGEVVIEGGDPTGAIPGRHVLGPIKQKPEAEIFRQRPDGRRGLVFVGAEENVRLSCRAARSFHATSDPIESTIDSGHCPFPLPPAAH